MIMKPKWFNLSLFTTLMLFALVFVLTQNVAFWREFFNTLIFSAPRDYLFAFSLIIVLSCVTAVLLALMLWSRLTSITLAILLVLSTLFNYYSYHYQIYMDRDMLTNIIETNTLEVVDLVSFKLVIWLILGALVPWLLLTRIQIKSTALWKSLLQRVGVIAGSIIVIGAVALGFYKDYASFFRNHREIIKLVMPTSYLTSYVSYAKKSYAQNLPFERIGEDAKLIKPEHHKKTLFVIVVGETARSQNFSLNGYGKETNPLLAKQTDLVSFQEVASCGTATAISVPCMFSKLTRGNFDKTIAENQENALDLLQKAGYTMLWRENDHGCKGVCNRLPTEDIEHANGQSEEAVGVFSYDENLLTNLDEYIAQHQNDENLVIALHMNGSHGPTYFQRYPEKFKKFTPSCDTSLIETCDNDVLTNTYDNTIVYTDYVLNQTIELLKTFSDDYETSMLYVSDHGESLGEKGFYLHGAPYAIAPKEQRTVPLIFWGSPEFYQNRHMDRACVKQKAQNDHYSHDNIFHTLLGLLYVQTTEYDPNLNIFAECTAP